MFPPDTGRCLILPITSPLDSAPVHNQIPITQELIITAFTKCNSNTVSINPPKLISDYSGFFQRLMFVPLSKGTVYRP
jgi:hypothetical protein